MTTNRRVFIKQLGLGAAGLSLVSFPSEGRAARTASRLPRSTPEAEGISSAAIQSFLEEAARNKHEMHGFMLMRHGKVAAEGWWAPYASTLNHTLYSMSKSFASTAAGFAAAEGKLSVNDKVASFFPGELPEKPSAFLAELRIKDLLSMSVGNEKEPTLDMVASENWVKTFLAAPIKYKPGTVFMYNSGATYMVSAIVQKITGQRILDYLTPRLFEPLGVEGATWETCPMGINTGGWGLSVPLECLSKFGLLYLQKGMWNGKRLLPQAWIEEATSFKIQQPLPEKPGRPNDKNDWLQGYCYQFWRSQHNAYRGDGAFGQYTIVMPDQDAVITINSETTNMQDQLDLIWKHLLPAMKSQPLPADPSAHAALKKTLASLALGFPHGNSTSATAARISGKIFAAGSESNFQSVSFEFKKGRCRLTLKDKTAEYPIECGLGSWRTGETALPGTPPRLISGGAPKAGTKSKYAASGAWKDQMTFEATIRYIETPHHDTVTCRFDENKVTVGFMNSIAKMSPSPKDKRPVIEGRIVL